MKSARQAIAEWTKQPKERHHIFPRAYEQYFTGIGVNIHDYTLIGTRPTGDAARIVLRKGPFQLMGPSATATGRGR